MRLRIQEGRHGGWCITAGVLVSCWAQSPTPIGRGFLLWKAMRPFKSNFPDPIDQEGSGPKVSCLLKGQLFCSPSIIVKLCANLAFRELSPISKGWRVRLYSQVINWHGKKGMVFLLQSKALEESKGPWREVSSNWKELPSLSLSLSLQRTGTWGL